MSLIAGCCKDGRRHLKRRRRRGLRPGPRQRALNLEGTDRRKGNGLTGNLLELASRTLGEEVVLVTDFASDLALCQVDPTQYELAILNVPINARDAMHGRGTLWLRTENVVVDAVNLASYEGLEVGR